MLLATSEAGNFTAWLADTAQSLIARRTTVEKFSLLAMTDKRKLMRSTFGGNSKIDTGLTPLGTMGLNPFSSRAIAREQVGQFVAQRFIDFSV